MIPCMFEGTIPYERDDSFKHPKQEALFMKEGGVVLIEMDYFSGSWRELPA